VSGQIINDQGHPVSNAYIGVKEHNGTELWGVAALIRSDSKGYFEILNAPCGGDYRLSVFGNDIQSASHTVDLSQGECLITALRSGRVYGQVIDAETGSPITCFQVDNGASLNDYEVTRLSYIWKKGEGVTFASKEGCFDTGGERLPMTGQVSLRVLANGYDPLTLTGLSIQSISEDPNRTVFCLQPNKRRSTIHVGRVVNIEGQPVEGAEVGYRVTGADSRERGFSKTVTDVSGMYTISGVNPDDQVMYVRAPGYAPSYFSMSDLLVQTPGTLTDVVLNPGANIGGTVWDENGHPMADATIHFFVAGRTEEDHRFTRNFNTLWPGTKTDALGHYQLTDLPIDQVCISVTSSDTVHIRPKKVTLNPGDSVEMNFGEEGGLVVTGVVTDGAKLLDYVEVELHSWDGGPESRFDAKTDSAGRFKFIHVPIRKYALSACRPRTEESIQLNDPNDQGHILYKVIDVQADLDLTVDYQTRTIN